MKKSKPKFIKREPESPEIIKRRWDFKKEQIEILANNIQKLRYNVTLGLKDSDNEKVFLTALVVAIILETSERVGNEASAQNQHVGITGLKKKQISIDGNKVTLEYTGKSGVEHIKSFSDEKIAKALKLAIKNSKTDDVFCTSDGFKIKADRINRFLSDFSVRAKDLRGMNCNKLMTDRLKNEEVSEDEKKRKKFFMQSLRKVAIKIGHGSGTLRKHYLIPELETNYIKNGNIIDISERESYEDGGEIKETFNDGGNLSKTPAPKKDKIYGSKINKPESAESKYNASSITLSPNVIKSIVNIIHKHNEEYPEKKINTSTAKAVVRRGMGAYSSTHRPTISEGKPNSRVAWGLARLNAFVYKIQNGKSKSGKYNQDDDLIDELGYKVKSYSKGGSVRDEFKCNYEKYFEYVPLSEIEKYIEFDREVEHKISKKYLDELTEEIKVNGITYPITLEIYGGKGLIVEGNHRIAVAKRLGIKYIPVRVIERYRPFTGTIYEDKVKELPSRRNSDYAKVMYGVKALDYDNSAAVHGFTKVEPKLENGGSIELLAPNGKKSNLTLEQYNLVRTENFKKWFGDWENDPENSSKVVDSNGEPMVVFHGTRNKDNDFNIFDEKFGNPNSGGGHYFSSSIEFASKFGKVKPFFLKIENPLLDGFDGSGAVMSRSNYRDGGIFTKRQTDRYAEKGTKEFVVFESSQIKLADGKNNTFDSNNPDVRFEHGGEIEKITFDNFYKGTKADFKEIMKVGIPKRKPDSVSDSGSKYWFTSNSVIRQSDHWGQLDACEWTLDGRSGHKITQGICPINNFLK